MLDINLIRKDPEFVSEKLALRGLEIDFTEFLANDQKRRDLIYTTEQLKAERNKSSAKIPQLKKEGKNADELLARMREIGDEIKANDQLIAELNQQQDDFVVGLPNLPADGVVGGGKENNQVIRTYGEKPKFDFEPMHHVDIVEHLGIVDYARGAKLSGAANWVYRGMGAQLEWALLNYFIQDHLADNYEMILPPHLLNYECGYTAGQFPKFVDDIFTLRAKDDSESEHGFKRFLLPTSETALVNLHRAEILNQSELPKKYFAYTPCYRSEAGSYRADERGMIRGHQFNKVEIFQYALPEESDQALEELIAKAEKLVQGLGLHYQVSKLAAEDCSASMRETYDIEVWIPSMNDYKEVSSASNAGDYQARRGAIRFKNEETGKNEFVHTLNASGLATSRIFPAIMEQNQQADGTVIIPEVLRPFMNGTEVIEPQQ
ncbi:MAG: serine--tRNA ligase [Clostridiaceae bacterium]|jgi:seryl-tRNA synthetase|nr:serine--tRNA ligase [Bacillota bacterium]NLN52558.1 serine--tRNA ligase [Clostridiaceae bacterium]